MTINELVKRSHTNAVMKGFWGQPDSPDDPLPPVNIGEKLMLIVSEVAEAMEEHRSGMPLNGMVVMASGKPEGFLVELADAVIRIADLAGYACEDLTFEQIILQKMDYNEGRPHKHGKAY